MSRGYVVAWVALVLLGGPRMASGAALRWAGSGDDLGAMRSVPLKTATGVIICGTAPTAGGFHTAAHCLEWAALPPAIPGSVVTGWSIDPDGRDLGHVQTEGAPASVPTTTLAVGEEATARVWDTPYITLRLAKLTGCRRIPSGLELDADGWPCGVLCVTGGRRVRHGDSGTGIWAHGTVWGVIDAADTRRPARSTSICGADQSVYAAIVP